MNLFMKLFLEVINLIFNNSFGFALLGRFRLFGAVFVMYPADQTFADYFTFRLRQKRITFRPFITGVATHPSGLRTLMFAISARIDSNSPPDAEDLRLLQARFARISSLLGAKTEHFAGTLPGRLAALRVRRRSIEQEATVENVVRAIRQVSSNRQVAILGARGYIGREVSKSLLSLGVDVIGVDKDGVFKGGNKISGEYVTPKVPHLLVNITAPEAINSYLDAVNDETVLLNEVYPAPHQDVVEAMKEKGARVLHIAGVEAKVWPCFPKEYAGAIPCCSAVPGEDYRVVTIYL